MSENQTLMIKKLHHQSNPHTVNGNVKKSEHKKQSDECVSNGVHNKEGNDMSHKLEIFGNHRSNSMDNNDEVSPEWHSNHDIMDDMEEENDLFTMVQNYENNDEYLLTQQHHEDDDEDIKDETNDDLTSNESILSNKSPSKDDKKRNRNKHQKKRIDAKDALDEYLHITASVMKINYPMVNATSKELVDLLKPLPFYQAHDYLKHYMIDKNKEQNPEQIPTQNKLSQLKAKTIGKLKTKRLKWLKGKKITSN